MKIFYYLVLLFNIAFALWLFTLSSHSTSFNYLYNILGSLNFLLGSLTSFYFSKKYSQHKIIFLGLGVSSLSYFLAQLTWYGYNTLYQSEIPYPSYTDLFFLIFYLTTIISGLKTMSFIKFKFNLGTFIEIIAVALVILLLSHSFMNSVSTSGPTTLLEAILNYAYPTLDAILISLTLAAIRSQYGRSQPMLLLFMSAFIALTFGDTIFAYQTSLDLYWNGNIVDVFFSLTGFFMAMAIYSMPSLLNAQDKKLT